MSSSLAITAPACCASVAGSSVHSVRIAHCRTPTWQSSSLAATASACWASVAGSSLLSLRDAFQRTSKSESSSCDHSIGVSVILTAYFCRFDLDAFELHAHLFLVCVPILQGLKVIL